MERRLKPLSTRFLFKAKPALPTGRQAAPELPGLIARGGYASQLFWFVKGAFVLLQRCKGPELQPVPHEVQEELREMFARGDSTVVVERLKANTKPCPRAEATKASAITEAMARACGLELRVAKQQLLRAGARKRSALRSKGCGNGLTRSTRAQGLSQA